MHSGATVHSGHYTAYARAPNGVWHNMDDECVDMVKLQSVLRANAYMLFYQRVQPAAQKKPPAPVPVPAVAPPKPVSAGAPQVCVLCVLARVY